MKKIKKFTLVLSIAAAMVLSSCSGTDALEKFDAASAGLISAKSISMDMDIGITKGDDQMNVSMVSEYEGPDTVSDSPADKMKMSILMTMDLTPEPTDVEYYLNEGRMYVGIPSMLDQYMYVPTEDPLFDELSSPTTSMKPDDFLVDLIDGVNIIVSETTVSYRGNDVKAECLEVKLTEENINQLYDILGTSAESIEMDTGSLIEAMDPNDFTYRVYLDEDGNIIVFRLSYTIGFEDDSSDLSVSINAEIYDVDRTVVDFPDFTDAIDLTDFQ